MSSTYKVFLNKMGGTSASSYIGKEGELFYDPTTTTLRISDGSTPGGTVVSANSGDTFDQELNTTDSPQFNRVGLTTGEITVTQGNNFSVFVSPDGETSYELNFSNTAGKLTVPGEVYGQYFTLKGPGAAGTEIGNLGYTDYVVYLNGANGVGIQTSDYESGPRWLFDTNGDLNLPSTVDAVYTIGESEGGLYINSSEGLTLTSNNFNWTFYQYGTMKYPVLTWAEISDVVEAGQRVFISDSSLEATAANFGEIVTGGGSNTAPVWSDGSYWRIG